ncbi:site-specific integrase [Faecalibacter bovis]|uniref:Site-specific integrase n=1 Tax=Faecalibacter bovis TaxID=2898187 RepID=A0ABX7XFQ3_9FLAO|nr:site-specific integrase [Faecalibacter bovis]QTV06735.1 site-specific integrase [Faecalibacter bovis]
MKQDLRLNVYLRNARVNKLGLVAIYLRITINGQRWDFSTNKFIDPKTWDAKNAKIKGSSQEASSINGYLDVLKMKIVNLEIEYSLRDEHLTLEDIKNFLTNKKKEVVRMLIPIFEHHNKQIKKLENKEFAPGTIVRYDTTLKHLKDFLLHKYNVEDIRLDKVDHAFIMDFDFYFRTERKCNNNTTVKYIKNFKKIINYCLANDWIQKDPFINYKVKIEKVERVFLSQDEIYKIYEKEHPAERLNLVRDIFIFSCYTGLAYVDVDNLTKNHIVKGIDGQLWIHTYRQKTSTATKIPLLDIPLQIIEKYKDHFLCKKGKLLPIFSNQKMNAYLKEIATIAEIDKELTFHCARHTFATTVTLSNGVPIESVSKMLGHTNITTTQHYARITEQKVSNDMDHLKFIINNKKAL